MLVQNFTFHVLYVPPFVGFGQEVRLPVSQKSAARFIAQRCHVKRALGNEPSILDENCLPFIYKGRTSIGCGGNESHTGRVLKKCSIN